jgi:hypothetical protein
MMYLPVLHSIVKRKIILSVSEACDFLCKLGRLGFLLNSLGLFRGFAGRLFTSVSWRSGSGALFGHLFKFTLNYVKLLFCRLLNQNSHMIDQIKLRNVSLIRAIGYYLHVIEIKMREIIDLHKNMTKFLLNN